ncbi:MAG: flagellar hook-associated protein FlgK [Spirochaetota bacterium]|nr:MAG: flagellar hook-associated protein FlgK [Spirochaetota bacterium]
MSSTFTGIEIGKRGILAHQTALYVTGHNVSNAETEGYSRQKVTLEVFDPLYIPGLTREQTPGQIGQGVQIEKILRARDMLLEDRILSEKNGLAYWRSLSDWIYQVELVHNEPTDKSIMTILDKFWASWHELANNPEEVSAREAVREYGLALTRHINHNYQALRTIRDNIERTIEMRVEEINSLAAQIARLNGEILRSEASGDNPNDLWDRRDLLVERLSELADIRIGRSDKDEFMVFIGGKHLVQGKHHERLLLLKNPLNEGYSDIYWEVDNSLLKVQAGEMRALLDARDLELKYQIDSLDTFALNLIDLVNSVHRRGFGLNLRTGLDFFREKPASIGPLGDFDFDRDGRIDGTAIFRITGTNRLKSDDIVGVAGTITLNNGIEVEYTRNDTVFDIITKVNNAGADLKLHINSDSRLVVKADTPRFYLSHIEDSGDFLVGYSGILNQNGEAGAFDSGAVDMSARISDDFMVTQWLHPSSWMALDDSVLGEVESIAASTGTDTDGDGIPDVSHGAGNGDNALKVASIRFDRVMIGKSTTINEFYQTLIAQTGLKGETSVDEQKNRELIVENLGNLRKSISGVNIDEELVNLVKFQHGYAAAARFVAEVDKMIEWLINRI